jgi:UDP-N-acetylglucosamine--N-acetylmuramyl-(pentapeptide) pyrophosphoryl-undecaprenol N-acetylglucosamine transferase
MKFVLAGGGTAGHIQPAISVAQAIKQSHPDAQLLFLGTSAGLENRLVPEAGFELALITKVSLPRKLSMAVVKAPFQLVKSIRQSRKHLQGTDVLIGFGGYVCAPAYLAAVSMGLPFVIHEANAKPGVANRLGALFTKKLAVATPVAKGRFSSALLTGLPLRDDVQKALISSRSDWAQARRKAKLSLGFDPDLALILIVGGSQGSVALNTTVTQSLVSLAAKRIQLLHSLGNSNQLPTTTDLYKPVAYISEMATAYLAADLIIARSGAVTCSEVNALGRYALFIPLPIGNGEQEVNAKFLVEQGRAEIIPQSLFTSQWVGANIERLLASSAKASPQGSDADADAAMKISNLIDFALSGGSR